MLPDPSKKVASKNYAIAQGLPFIVYADFEALVKSTGRTQGEPGHNSLDYETQTACSVAYVVLSVFPNFHRAYKSYTGQDCVRCFLADIVSVERLAMDHYFDDRRLVMSELQQAMLETITKSMYCLHRFDPQKRDEVGDQDHLTGEYRGAAQNKWNLAAHRTCKVPIFFHYLSGYDAHFITQAHKCIGGQDIKLNVQGMEKYLKIQLRKL